MLYSLWVHKHEAIAGGPFKELLNPSGINSHLQIASITDSKACGTSLASCWNKAVSKDADAFLTVVSKNVGRKVTSC